jgi:HEAT repeat protein
VPAATNILTPEQHQTAIDAETDRLQEWSVNDDPASLSNILADLTNPDKEIRVAAIEAARQFGSADAIPALKAAADATDDLQEKNDDLQAADFLSLPGISDSSVQLPLTPEQIQANAQRNAERVSLDQDEVKHHVLGN